MKTVNSLIQEAQLALGTRNLPRHIKLVKISVKEKILKAFREKDVKYKGAMTKLIAYFFWEKNARQMAG